MQLATEDFVRPVLGEHVGKDFVEVLTNVDALRRFTKANLVELQVAKVINVLSHFGKEGTLHLGRKKIINAPVAQLVQHNVHWVELAVWVQLNGPAGEELWVTLDKLVNLTVRSPETTTYFTACLDVFCGHTSESRCPI